MSEVDIARDFRHMMHADHADLGTCTRSTRHATSVHAEDLLQICHPFQTGFWGVIFDGDTGSKNRYNS